MNPESQLIDFPHQDAETWFRRAKCAELRMDELTKEIQQLRRCKPLSQDFIDAHNAKCAAQGVPTPQGA